MIRLVKLFVWLNLYHSRLIQQTTNWWYFSWFSQETGFNISCKMSPLETICMKCQILFSDKNKKNISKMSFFVSSYLPICLHLFQQKHFQFSQTTWFFGEFRPTHWKKKKKNSHKSNRIKLSKILKVWCLPDSQPAILETYVLLTWYHLEKCFILFIYFFFFFFFFFAWHFKWFFFFFFCYDWSYL